MKGEPEWTYEEYDEISQRVTECEIAVGEIRDDLDRFHKGATLRKQVKVLAEAVDRLRHTINEYW